jgi:hypothetical protein
MSDDPHHNERGVVERLVSPELDYGFVYGFRDVLCGLVHVGDRHRFQALRRIEFTVRAFGFHEPIGV